MAFCRRPSLHRNGECWARRFGYGTQLYTGKMIKEVFRVGGANLGVVIGVEQSHAQIQVAVTKLDKVFLDFSTFGPKP